MRAWPLALPLAITLGLAAGGCDRPKEAECRKAIENIDRVTGRQTEPGEQAAAVRTCRAQATRKAVACWQAAKTPQELEACEGPVKK